MCFYPLGESRSPLCACADVVSFADRNGVVTPNDVPKDCRDAATSLAFTESCREMKVPKICSKKNVLFSSWDHSCQGLKLSLTDVCEKKQRVKLELRHSPDMFRFLNAAVDSSEGREDFVRISI